MMIQNIARKITEKSLYLITSFAFCCCCLIFELFCFKIAQILVNIASKSSIQETIKYQFGLSLYKNHSLKLFMKIEEEEHGLCKLPKRPAGLYSKQKFRNVEIVTNFYPVSIKPIQEIYIFRIKFQPQIMEDDRKTRVRVLEKAMDNIKLNIRTFFMIMQVIPS